MADAPDVIQLDFDPDVTEELRDEFGSLNKVFDRLQHRLDQAGVRGAEVQASSADDTTGGATTRGGLVEIVCLGAADAAYPIIAQWFEARRFVVVKDENVDDKGTHRWKMTVRKG